jgi:hypothetical protein
MNNLIDLRFIPYLGLSPYSRTLNLAISLLLSSHLRHWSTNRRGNIDYRSRVCFPARRTHLPQIQRFLGKKNQPCGFERGGWALPELCLIISEQTSFVIARILSLILQEQVPQTAKKGASPKSELAL